MDAIHYAAIEAGRVTPLCGGRARSRFSWTTKRHAVTCDRCQALLSEPDAVGAWEEDERAGWQASPRA